MTTTLPRDIDVIVVGGGSGGLTVATHSARRGARVVMVSDGPLGGDCTHTGCVPSKTLLSAAADGLSFDDAMRRVGVAIDRIARTEDEAALGRVGIDVVRGRGRLVGPRALDVDGRVLRARHVVLATGSKASLPHIAGIATADVVTNESLFDLSSRPTTMAVLGGGPIGCEMAQAFARLGTAVTVLEGADRILPGEDPAVAVVIAAALEADGVKVVTAARVEQVTRAGDTRCVTLADGAVILADEVLVATGRKAVTDGLGLEAVGVETDSAGRIVVTPTCATNVPGVWAVGDVTQFGGFTHVAGNMGFTAAVNVTRRSRLIPELRIERRVVPRVVYTSPEVAQVGLTEAEAASVGGRVAEVRFDHVDRAITAGRTEGFVKLIAGPRPITRSLAGGRVLGATMVGPSAGELIGEVGLAMKTRMFTGRLAQTTHAYPTWSMALQQAATQFFFETDSGGARPARP